MRITFNAPVVLGYSLLCSMAYLLLDFLGVGRSLFVLDGNMHAASPSWWFSLVGYSMGHASVEHLLGNLSFVLLLGPLLEEKYGSKNLAIMILITAGCTAVLHVLFFDEGLLGASGIVFMMILLMARVGRGSGIPLTLILVVVLFIGKELIHVFKDDHISQFAHLAGGAFGLLLGSIYSKSTGGGIRSGLDGI